MQGLCLLETEIAWYCQFLVLFLVNNLKPVNRSASEQQFMDLLAYRPFTLFCNCSFIIRVINNFLIQPVTCWMKLKKLLLLKNLSKKVLSNWKVKFEFKNSETEVEAWVKNAEKSCLWSSHVVYMCSCESSLTKIKQTQLNSNIFKQSFTNSKYLINASFNSEVSINFIKYIIHDINLHNIYKIINFLFRYK